MSENVEKDDFEQTTQSVTEVILESISDGVFTVNNEWRLTSFNRAAETITGISREEAVGKHCWEVFRSNMCETDCALRQTMNEGKSFLDSSVYIVNRKRISIPVVVCTSPLKDNQGKLVGGVETFRDMSLVEGLRKELDGRYHLGDIVSCSPSMRKIFTVLPQVAESDSTVLIQGETGTGKELLAGAIHELSPRRQKPFVAVNCGALPDTLLESELFGYKSGAFTNATKDKPGRFAMAEGGTIFLDEIGDLSPAFQVRLLRVLQERTYQPLGATLPVKADVRVVTATHKNLMQLIEEDSFRRDLFYRVNVVQLDLPPLRERKEDISLLVVHFINHFNLLRGRSVSGISPEALAQLVAYDYPGNIRELENIIEHAFILCHEGRIELDFLPDVIRKSASNPAPTANKNLADTLKSVEAQTILDILKRNDYDRLATARELGMHKSTLFRKIKSLGITLPKLDGRSKRRKVS